MNQNIALSLGLPEQDLYRLSSCVATKEGVAGWLASLPHANMGETSRNLFRIISELVRLRLPSRQRFEILEILYPSVRKTCVGLAKHYLNQAIILPKKAQQVVDLAHTLQNELATGYLLVALNRDDKKSLFKKRADAVTDIALYRASCLQTEILLRSYQLYATVPERTWLKLHTQYRLACEFGVANDEITDSFAQRGAASSIHDCYVHALLLGCIKANQLRQEDLTIVHKLLPEWSNLARLNQANCEGKRPLFVVDPSQDRSPLFTKLVATEADLGAYTGIDSSLLVEHLRELMLQSRQQRVVIDKSTVSGDLLKHLTLAWGQCSKRSFMRMETDNELQICVGLSSAHYFAANQLSFEDMIELAKDALQTNPKLKSARSKPVKPKSGDPWAVAVDVDPLQKKANIAMETIDYQLRSFNIQSRTALGDQFQNFNVRVLNASPGGYSLTWPETTTAKIKAGDLVAIREQDASHWSIGAVRWLHRPNKADVQFGVELLSPAFMPTIARVVASDREPGEFTRVLLLPEISVTAQLKTLLVPHMRFVAGQKVQIMQDGTIVTVKLQKQLTHTGAYAQFTYHLFDAANDANMSHAADNQSKFDSLWANL